MFSKPCRSLQCKTPYLENQSLATDLGLMHSPVQLRTELGEKLLHIAFLVKSKTQAAENHFTKSHHFFVKKTSMKVSFQCLPVVLAEQKLRTPWLQGLLCLFVFSFFSRKKACALCIMHHSIDFRSKVKVHEPFTLVGVHT